MSVWTSLLSARQLTDLRDRYKSAPLRRERANHDGHQLKLLAPARRQKVDMGAS